MPMLRTLIVGLLLFFFLSACDSSGENECFSLEMTAWEKQRAQDEVTIKKIQSLWEDTEERIGSTIFHNPDYIQASVTAKNEIFRRVIATDVNFLKANEATQLAIEQKFGVSGNALAVQMESKESAKARIFKECKKLTSAK